MTPSARCEALIKSFESCSKPVLSRPGWFAAYWATASEQRRGIATIGWGSTGPDVRIGMVWSQAECDVRFDRDLSAFGVGVYHDLNGAATTQDQFDALVSFGYNVGLENEAHSTLLRLHCAGDYTGATAEFAKWNHQDGVVVNGLTRRRTAEAALYRGNPGD